MSVAPAHDRLQFLLAGQTTPTWNGIDYVEIANAEQTHLRVHFLNAVVVAGSLEPSLPVTICGGETVGSVAVRPIDETTDWSADDDGRPVLALAVAAPGDFSIYTLTIREHGARSVLRLGAVQLQGELPERLRLRDCGP